MGRKSQENGKKFEELFIKYLNKLGWFVIYNEKGITGSQPADLIAISPNETKIFECKNLDNKSGIFPLDRIESNQRHAFKKYDERGNMYFMLTICWDNKIYIKNFKDIDFTQKSIDLKKEKAYIPIESIKEDINENIH